VSACFCAPISSFPLLFKVVTLCIWFSKIEIEVICHLVGAQPQLPAAATNLQGKDRYTFVISTIQFDHKNSVRSKEVKYCQFSNLTASTMKRICYGDLEDEKG
jgi:hypothetical protein